MHPIIIQKMVDSEETHELDLTNAHLHDEDFQDVGIPTGLKVTFHVLSAKPSHAWLQGDQA